MSSNRSRTPVAFRLVTGVCHNPGLLTARLLARGDALLMNLETQKILG
jgi:hypothetical protein